MFVQVWKKYLPVITILLKRSVNGVQTLEMNHTDFERAAGGKKVKFNFSSLQIVNGRVTQGAKNLPIAKDLASVLLDNELTFKLIKKQQLEFSMMEGFQLVIQNNTTPDEPEQRLPDAELNEDTANDNYPPNTPEK